MDQDITSKINEPPEPIINYPHLTKRHLKFIEAYIQTNDSHESAIMAGYSVKSAQQEGCRLLKKPKIISALAQWRKQRISKLSKDDYVSKAMNDYETVDTTHPNRPRYLDLAGKALGYIGSNSNNDNRTLNVQINSINLKGTESQSELWELTRKLLQSQ